MAYIDTNSQPATLTERDVRKGVTNVIALKTPVTSTIGKDPAPLNTTPEWEVKTYAARTAAGVLEGYKPQPSDYQSNITNKGMLKGRFIKQWRPVAVTKEEMLMANQYNTTRDVLADNVMDKSTEIYSDVEFFLLSDTECVAPASGSVASSGRSIYRSISYADSRYTDSATTPDSKWRPPASSILVSKTNASDVAETDVTALITSVATARREAGLRFMGLCTPLMRDQFDGFSRTDKSLTSSAYPVSRFSQTQGTINREVTLYKSSNGSVELMTTFDNDSTVHFGLISPDLVRIAYAQGVKVQKEGASSQVEERVIDVIYVPKNLNPAAHGKIITGATA